MGSGFLLWVDVGPHMQEQAAALVAQVVARVREVPLWLTDGWKAYRAALLQVLGVVYRRRRRGRWGASSAVPAALCSSCACENSAQRSKLPAWSVGMGPCKGWSHPCGAAPAVCPGAVPATGDGSG
jgi:hypothetical protein